MVALVGVSEAEEEEEQPDEQHRMVRREHHRGEERQVNRDQGEGNGSRFLLVRRLQMRQRPAEDRDEEQRVDEDGDRGAQAERGEHHRGIPAPGARHQCCRNRW